MRQLALDLSARPEPSFATFVPGRNAELLAALCSVSRGEGQERFIYLWGRAGSGRSHLLHAVTAGVRKHGRHADFLAAPVAAGIIEQRGADLLLALDDVECLDADGQRALFGLYNRMRESGGALIASGQAAPAGIGVRPDLATRLAWGLVYEVHALSDDEKAEAMSARAAARGFALSADVRAYMLHHGRRDLQSLLALIDALDQLSLETRRAVTLPLAREVLKSVSERVERE